MLLFGDLEGLVKVTEGDHDLNGLVELSVLHKEMHTLLQDLWVVTFLDAGRDVLDHISEVVLDSKVHCLLAVSTSAEELDGFVVLTLGLEVCSGLDHVLLTGLQAHGHNFLIIVVVLCKSDRVVKTLGFRVVNDSLSDVLALLVMPGQMEACLGITGFESDLKCVLNVTDHTEESDDATPVLSLSVVSERVLEHALGFKVLSPPLEEFGLSLSLHEGLETVEVPVFTEHAWNLNSMGVTLDEVSDGAVELTDAFEVFGKRVMSVFEVDTIVFLSNL